MLVLCLLHSEMAWLLLLSLVSMRDQQSWVFSLPIKRGNAGQNKQYVGRHGLKGECTYHIRRPVTLSLKRQPYRSTIDADTAYYHLM